MTVTQFAGKPKSVQTSGFRRQVKVEDTLSCKYDLNSSTFGNINEGNLHVPSVLTVEHCLAVNVLVYSLSYLYNYGIFVNKTVLNK